MTRRPWRDYRREYIRRTRPLAVRVDSETRKEVEDYAKREKITIAEVLKRFIDWGLASEHEAQ